jgi:cytochrome c-type biogenesis protein CcmH/NrfG
MRRALRITPATILYGIVAVVIGLVAAGQAPLWLGAIAVSYIAIKVALTWMLAPTEEEVAGKDRAWLAELNRDCGRVRTVEDRLDELERLKRRDLVTPEEYAAKRQEILKDL